MTSVSIISAVAARIKYLIDEPDHPPSWNNDDAEQLRSKLESISQFLKDADQVRKHNENFVTLEKKIVRKSYDVDDFLSEIKLGFPSKPKGMMRGMLVHNFERTSKADARSLINELQSIIHELASVSDIKKENKDSPPAQTSTEANPASATASTGEDLKEALLKEDLLFKGKITNMVALISNRGSKAIKYFKNDRQGINKEPAPALDIKKENKDQIPTPTSHEADPSSPTAKKGNHLAKDMENDVKEALLKENLPVVCIWGKSCMGKTTLAKKVFYNAKVRKNFEVFAWVHISRDFQTKKVLQDILLHLLPDKKDDIIVMDEIELSQKVFKVQRKKKCLIVLEDMRNEQDWKSIRVALAIGKSSSKILITTRSEELAEAAASKDGVFSMKPLNETECFNILKEKASFNKHELQAVGKIIFNLSEGSPLMAIILGKSLKTVDETARNQLVKELDYYINQSSDQGETQVFGLCYDRLPNELKPCFLYMGQFPEGQDIEVEKLHLLFSAEGIIPPEDSARKKTMFKESVRDMLENLAHKKLVEMHEDKVSMTRMYKSCRLHDQIRKFCIKKGLDEEFFEVVKFGSGKKVGLSTRRLAVYLSNIEDGDAIPFSSHDMVKKVRSLLIFDTHQPQRKSTWPAQLNDLKEFIHLRVLDFDGVDFRVWRFPRGIDRLVFLRYLSFRRCWLVDFPFYIIAFPYLETLDLRVNENCKMTIPNVLSNMKKLRHLYFPMLYENDGNTKLQLRSLEKLEVLVNFDTGACNVDDLSELKNLQILATISEGKHKELEAITKYLDEKAANLQQSSLDIRNFDYYTRDRAAMIKKLLECKYLNSLHIEGQIGQLPKGIRISPNFSELVFDGSEIEDDPMNVLEKLPNLRSLVLMNDAFLGEEMSFSSASKFPNQDASKFPNQGASKLPKQDASRVPKQDVKFPNLRSLKLLNLQYLEKVTFEKGAMPKLSTLVIDKCDYLEEVSMPKALDKKLHLAQGKKGDDVYLVRPFPTIN